MKIPDVFGGDWLWPSRLTSKSKFTPFWVCEFVHAISHHWLKDFQIWTKIHLGTVRIPIDFGIDWPQSSVVFLISNQLFFCKLHVSYSFASFCIYLVMPSPLWCFALRLLAVCMVSGNLNTTWFNIWLHSDRPTWEMIWKLFFTFHF